MVTIESNEAMNGQGQTMIQRQRIKNEIRADLKENPESKLKVKLKSNKGGMNENQVKRLREVKLGEGIEQNAKKKRKKLTEASSESYGSSPEQVVMVAGNLPRFVWSGKRTIMTP